jgi:hypothetical protein
MREVCVMTLQRRMETLGRVEKFPEALPNKLLDRHDLRELE